MYARTWLGIYTVYIYTENISRGDVLLGANELREESLVAEIYRRNYYTERTRL